MRIPTAQLTPHYGQHEAALKDLKIAADLNPAKELVQFSMAQEDMRLAKYDEAIEAYEREIELLPEHERFVTRYNIGIAHKFAGRYEAAIKAFLCCKATVDCPEKISRDCDSQIEACAMVLRRLGRPLPELTQ